MANSEHIKILKQGVEVWDKWRDKNDKIKPDLRNAYLYGANLSGANLSKADLREANLNGTNLSNANLREADLSGANLNYADFRGADLSKAHIGHADLDSANLSSANLSGARLYGVNLIKADLKGANLRNAEMPNSFLKEANLIGADFREATLGGSNFMGADLREARLSGAHIVKANLYKANLSGANLSNANLREADLSWAILTGANLKGADLSGADLLYADITKANLTKAILNRASFVETKLEGADLTGSNIYGISAWDLKINKDTKQLNLVITKDNEPIVTVDDIEVAQLIYLLIRHEKLRQVINSVAEKGVLILGRFGGGGIEVLRAVAEKLRKMKYLPIIFDFDRPRDKNYTETIKTLAGLSRFVVVDLSGPSVPQELYATVPHFKIPFIPILEKGKQKYAMFADILEFDWVMKPIVEFDSIDSLINSITSKVVNPAEKRLEKRQKLLFELFGK